MSLEKDNTSNYVISYLILSPYHLHVKILCWC